MSASNHYCIFQVAGDFFAAAATQIREITSKPGYATAPCSSSVLAGVWHEGSEFLPMLRLPFQANSDPDNETHVLVIHGPFGRWGLLVDHVHNIATIECSQGNEACNNEWSTALMGMSTWNGQSVRVLNLDGLYRLSEEMLEYDWTRQIDATDEGRMSSERKAIGS